MQLTQQKLTAEQMISKLQQTVTQLENSAKNLEGQCCRDAGGVGGAYVALNVEASSERLMVQADELAGDGLLDSCNVFVWKRW